MRWNSINWECENVESEMHLNVMSRNGKNRDEETDARDSSENSHWMETGYFWLCGGPFLLPADGEIDRDKSQEGVVLLVSGEGRGAFRLIVARCAVSANTYEDRRGKLQHINLKGASLYES
jgi:hypothetical protein